MSFIDQVLGVFRRVAQSAKDIADLNLPRKITESKEAFGYIFSKDWSNSTEEEREAAVARIKNHVIHDLIPTAGQLSLFGAPGILVYTPCQIAGALAIAKVYDSNYDNGLGYILTIAGIMFWGQAGQFTWIQIANLVRDSIPNFGLGIVVIPYVQEWTRIALNTVHSHFRTQYTKSQPSNKSSKNQDTKSQPSNKSSKNQDIPNTQPKRADRQPEKVEVVNTIERLKDRINKGGKILFSAQEEVFRELVDTDKSYSALTLGRVHTFRGVAGSGKTIILAQLVPHLITAFKEKYGREPSILIYHFNNYIRRLLEQEILSAILSPIDLDPMTESEYKRIVYVHTLKSLVKSELPKNNLLTKNISFSNSMTNSEKSRQIITHLRHDDGIYDIILIDEGQDISEDELTLITDLCRNNSALDSKSIYIFYDDFQNIFGNQGSVVKRVKSIPKLIDQLPIEHFLSRCIRTSKIIIDFTFNTCLGTSLDYESREKLKLAMNLEKLYENKLVVDTIALDGSQWFDSRFCVFPGEVVPEVVQFNSNDQLNEALREDLKSLIQEWKELNIMLRNEGFGFHRRSVLIQCFNNATAEKIFNVLARQFNRPNIAKHEQIVHLRSGKEVRNKEKQLAVEVSRINIANVWDAKGYDADTVYIINPDGCKGSPYEKRTQFYVASTRAKQFLAVYSSLPERQAPIVYDAVKAMKDLKSRNNSYK